MKQLTTVIVILFAASLANAQGWEWQNPSPSGNTLNKVIALDESTCLAVGRQGTIIRTTDGGQHWSNFPDSIQADLNGACFLNAHEGWIVTAAYICDLAGCDVTSTVYHTQDGAATWSAQYSDSTRTGNAVAFANSDTGWVVGNYGLILHTTNGGLNWSEQQSGQICNFRSVACIKGMNAWAVGDSMIVRTTDGGATWSTLSDPNRSLKDVCFTDRLTGWAVGSHSGVLSPVILHTTNGGTSWTPQFSPGVFTELCDVEFLDALRGWALGSTGTILHTSNGGASWLPVQVSDAMNLSSFSFATRSTAWAVGYNGSILHTSDGWETSAQEQRTKTTAVLKDVYFLDEQHGWIVGQSLYPVTGVIFRTTNGGLTWNPQPAPDSPSLNGVIFTDLESGWAVGGDYSSGDILHTTDGGTNWSEQGISDVGSINKVVFTDDHHGWAVGQNPDNTGLILRSLNGGTTWSRQTVSNLGSLRDVAFVNAQKGWAVGDAGKIASTSNGGALWTTHYLDHAYDLSGVAFANSNRGWAVGYAGDTYSGVIVSTIDGGETWNTVYSEAYQSLKKIVISDPATIWAVGISGTIVGSTDGGLTWRRRISICSGDLYAVAFPTPDCGYCVGDNGAILRFGLPQIVDGVGRNPQLVNSYTFTAYPNPFNPTTTLSFDLPSSGRVRLSVYDITGRLVQTLADRISPAGQYRLNFDGSALPSGVYFAQLRGSGYSQTQKLMLLK